MSGRHNKAMNQSKREIEDTRRRPSVINVRFAGYRRC
jgi:hypothetical protein